MRLPVAALAVTIACAFPAAAEAASISSFPSSYQAGDSGTVAIQLLDGSGLPQSSGSCHVTAYQPNGSFLFSGEMEAVPNSLGLYVFPLDIPDVAGVYPVEVNCSGPEAYGLSQFQVSSWARDIEETVISQTRGCLLYTSPSPRD